MLVALNSRNPAEKAWRSGAAFEIFAARHSCVTEHHGPLRLECEHAEQHASGGLGVIDGNQAELGLRPQPGR